MRVSRVSLLLASLMVTTAVLGWAVRPVPLQREPGAVPRYLLKDVVPRKFGSWQELQQTGVQVVNPQTQQILDKIYSQTLSRTYVNADGQRIMLSLAYGDDQRGGLQAHKPEVCYPAQGFVLHRNASALIGTPFGDIPARRLSTSLGQRKEPVSYWFTAGDTVVKNKIELRLVEIKMGLTGEVPDGLLFRVSSIDDNPEQAYRVHDAFVADLLQALTPVDRKRLSGLDGRGAPN